MPVLNLICTPPPLLSRSYIARINWQTQVAAAADRTRRKSDEVGGDSSPFPRCL